MKSILLMFLCMYLPVTALAEPVVITAVGDIMLSGSGERVFKKLGYDYPFDATREILKSSDIVTGNLEAPLAANGVEFTEKKFRFKTAPKAATSLKNAGFNHLTLANNHILDFGVEGLEQTLAALDAIKITHSGAGLDLSDARKASVVEVKGVKIALLSYSLTYPDEFFAGSARPGAAPGYASIYVADIRKAKESVDCVIVSFHWGGEGLESPKPYQLSVAHNAVDAGADIVLGHHPHVLQGVEYYGKGIIFYSLGNFAFGSLSRTSSQSMIARIVFDGGLKEVEIIPLNVRNSEVRFQPRPLEGRQARKAAEAVNFLSAPMGSRVTDVDGRFLVVRQND
ncbi:MAG: CapA family protein [Geobacteraceae bacterium]|nr:CapA family protein [Geobacteraceae bacterium]